MQTHTSKEFVVVIENKPGTVAEITTALGSANVNVMGFLVQAQGDFGTIRFVTSDPAKTEGWLKTTRYTFREREIATVRADNKPGELGRLSHKIAASGVNIEAAYPILADNNESRIAFSVDNVPSTLKALGN